MTSLEDMKEISGGGGGGGGKAGGGSSPRTPREDPDDLQSKAVASFVMLIGEGENVGLENGAKDVFLDRTPLQNEDDTYNFEGIEWHERTGTVDQEPIPGISTSESETTVNVQVRHGTSIIRRITDANIDALRIKIRIPGLYRVIREGENQGDILRYSVTFRIEYRSSGGAWQNPFGNDLIVKGKTNSPYEAAYKVNLEGNAPWDIRITRVSEDDDSAAKHSQTFFQSYTEIIEEKFSYPYCHVVGARVDTSLFGSSLPKMVFRTKGRIVKVPVNYNPLSRSYSGMWNGRFKMAWSDNPAWCYRDLLTNTRYGLGLSIDEDSIDDGGLYAIARYCDEQVPDGFGGMETRMTCNLVINAQEEAYRVINDMASIFRGLTFWASGSLSLMQDRPKDPEFLATNANVLDGEFNWSTTSLRTRKNAVIVAYNDPDNLGQQALEYATDNRSVSRYGYRPRNITAFGCNSRGQAKRLARWALLTEQNHVDSVTYRAGEDHAWVVPGTVIEVSDKDNNQARWGGRALRYSDNEVWIDSAGLVDMSADDATRKRQLEEGRLEYDASGTWTFRYANREGTLSTSGVASVFEEFVNPITLEVVSESAVPDGEANEWRRARVVLNDNLPTGLADNFVWAMADSTNEETVEMQVVKVGEVESGVYEITAVTYLDSKYRQIEEGIDFDSLGSGIYKPGDPIAPPTNVVATFGSVMDQPTPTVVGTVSWSAPDDERITRFELQVSVNRGPYQDSYFTTQVSHDLVGLLYNREYKFRVRSISENGGRVSLWTESTGCNGENVITTAVNGCQIGDRTIPASEVTGLTATGVFRSVSLEWTNPANEQHLTEVEIYRTTTSAAPVLDGDNPATPITKLRGESWTDNGAGYEQTFYYWVRTIVSKAPPSPLTGPVSAMGEFLSLQGIDGEDGVGVEYIFTTKESATPITGTANLPDPNWNYEDSRLANGITRGFRTYYDGEPPNSGMENNEYRIRFRRRIEGFPAPNEDIGEVAWIQEPAILVRAQDGEDGADGAGVEYIFTAKADDAAITGNANLPLGTWNYDAPGLVAGITRGDQTYYDGTPRNLDEDRPFMIRFRREVSGSPDADTDIGNTAWTQEPAVRAFGRDGEQGLDGEDGQGTEQIFAVHNYETLPLSLYPLDNAGYDLPAQVAGGGATERVSRRNSWREPQILKPRNQNSFALFELRYGRGGTGGAPDRPSPSGGTFPSFTVGGSFTGRSWSSTVPEGSGQLYYTVGVRSVGETRYQWDTPVAISGRVSTRVIRINSATAPLTPNGGSYNDGTWTNPSGWTHFSIGGAINQDTWFSLAVAEDTFWPRGAGETRTLTWYDGKNSGLPDPDSDNPYLAVARRTVRGAPARGSDILDVDDVRNTRRTQWEVQSTRIVAGDLEEFDGWIDEIAITPDNFTLFRRVANHHFDDKPDYYMKVLTKVQTAYSSTKEDGSVRGTLTFSFSDTTITPPHIAPQTLGWIWVASGFNPNPPVPTCFPGYTKVLMSDGNWRAISDIRIGERLQGRYSESNKVLWYDRVILGRHNTPYLACVNGDFETTTDHMLLSRRGWGVLERKHHVQPGLLKGIYFDDDGPIERHYDSPQDVGEVAVGDWLAHGCGWRRVDSIVMNRLADLSQTVYGLAVDGDGTMQLAGGYVVGATVQDHMVRNQDRWV